MLENSNNHVCNGAYLMDNMVFPVYTDLNTGEALFEDQDFTVISNITSTEPIEVPDLQKAIDAYLSNPSDIGFVLDSNFIYILHQDSTYSKLNLCRTSIIESGEYDTLESRDLEDLEIY